MAGEPRNPPARSSLLHQGRTNVAAVVATASVMGATAGAVVPALAKDTPPAVAITACADPQSTTPQDDTLECAKGDQPLGEPSTGDATTTTAKPTPTSPADPPDAPAGPPANVSATPPPTPAAITPATPAAEPAAIASPTAATPQTGVPVGLRASVDPRSQTAGVSAHMSTAIADQVGRPGTDKQDRARIVTSHVDAAGAKVKSSRPTSPTRSDSRSPRPAKPPANDAASTAPLPASWTSLTPLTLRAFGVKGFPIPPALLPIYQAAAAQYGVPWEILASINEIESDFGRNAGVSSAGALGWMQFIPSSWKRWGTDGDADRRRDPRDPVDAIFAAARYLHGAGARTDLPKAIFAYNHAGWYVDKVVERAREFAGLDPMLVAALSSRALREDSRHYRARGNPFAGDGAIEPSPGQALLLTKHQLSRIVLHSDDIHVYPGGRRDVADGHVDRRVLATLVFLARSGLKPTVSCLMTGHALRTTSGNISAHSYGHAVDISAIGGVPIAGHQGAESITAKTLGRLVRMQGFLRPNQIISLMTVDGEDNTLAMSDHDDHIHVGFPRVPRVPHGARPVHNIEFTNRT
ncbi:MAG: hypothetical protein QOE31_3771 [Solirubrobacteraceae bacterium]|nr:hypothetical protein [Solirubrobacteraceae bacterium]